MITYRFAAVATLAMLATLFWTAVLVGKARGRYGVKAPAVSGNETFERTYRAQMNTLEQFVVMLPALWLMAAWVSDAWAGVAGLVWIAGRIVYVRSYIAEPTSRSAGFAITILAFAVAWGASLVAIVMTMLR